MGNNAQSFQIRFWPAIGRLCTLRFQRDLSFFALVGKNGFESRFTSKGKFVLPLAFLCQHVSRTINSSLTLHVSMFSLVPCCFSCNIRVKTSSSNGNITFLTEKHREWARQNFMFYFLGQYN